MSDSDLYARAREVASIEDVAGVRLFRSGRRLRGECPLCGASKGHRSDGAFSVDAEKGLYKCFGCDAAGDVVRLEQELRGGTPREAALRLVGELPAGETRVQVREIKAAPAPTGSSERIAADLWRQGRPAAASPAQAYLAGRGIVGPVAEAALGRLKFHPNAFWGIGDGGGPIRAPAMLAKVETPGGFTGGIHVTYLRPSGAGFAKAALTPAKRMWGPQKDEAERPGAAWLIGPEGAGGPLVVGEGIESTLSAAILLGSWPCRAVATLSLRALQGGWKSDRFGRRSPDLVLPDPEAPAFTWHGDWTEVLIAVDRDMSPQKMKARGFAGGTYQRTLSADERARACGGLAIAHWRRERPEVNAVRCIAPQVAGRDFNDELMARGGSV